MRLTNSIVRLYIIDDEKNGYAVSQLKKCVFLNYTRPLLTPNVGVNKEL